MDQFNFYQLDFLLENFFSQFIALRLINFIWHFCIQGYFSSGIRSKIHIIIGVIMNQFNFLFENFFFAIAFIFVVTQYAMSLICIHMHAIAFIAYSY